MVILKRNKSGIASKVIFDQSDLDWPEVRQLGRAALSKDGFTLSLEPGRAGRPCHLSVPLQQVRNVRAFQKKSYSSTSYVVQVEFAQAESVHSVSFEIRVFFKRGLARDTARAWKDHFRQLAPDRTG